MAHGVVATSVPKRTGERTSERALSALWQRSDSLSEGLVTEEGCRFRVLYPGRSNPRAGPDFHDAIVCTEAGLVITGDVELHLDAPDWYRHRHDTDPNYNGVILHVVLRTKGKRASRQESRRTAPVVSMAGVADTLQASEAPAEGAVAGLGEMEGQGLGDLLDRAGDERFLAKSEGYALEMAETDPDQVLYRALMEALGYASNRKPFRALADRTPIASINVIAEEPATTRLFALKAMLIGSAGLLSHVEPPEEAQQMRRVLKHLPRTRAMSKNQWNLFRVRPANHPVRRLAGAAHILDRHIRCGLVVGLEEEVRGGDGKTLTHRLTARPFIGKGRARDVAVNVVLPLLYAYAGLKRSHGLRRRCLTLYRTFPNLANNEITREVKRVLGLQEGAMETNTARRQQGLIHIYKSWTTGALADAPPRL